MRVLAKPAFQSRTINPYNWLLYTNIEKLGVRVDEFFPQRLLLNEYAIWHLHWPELPLNNKNIAKTFIKIQALFFHMDLARSRGVKIIWTLHNLSAHERLYPKLEGWFWKSFIKRLDGYISLSQTGMEAAQEHFPGLKTLPGFVIPHGHYREEYPNNISSGEARSLLGISSSAKVLLFFGRIRPYKNTVKLIQVFKQCSDPETTLYIAGLPEYSSLAEELKQEASLDPTVRLDLDFISKDKAQIYFRAADLVVLPYQEVLNSGSALLALSFNCPVLVPFKGALSELQALVGKEWVHTYTGELNSVQIKKGLEWALITARSKQAPIEALDWKNLAQQTINAFKSIVD